MVCSIKTELVNTVLLTIFSSDIECNVCYQFASAEYSRSHCVTIHCLLNGSHGVCLLLKGAM